METDHNDANVRPEGFTVSPKTAMSIASASASNIHRPSPPAAPAIPSKLPGLGMPLAIPLSTKPLGNRFAQAIARLGGPEISGDVGGDSPKGAGTGRGGSSNSSNVNRNNKDRGDRSGKVFRPGGEGSSGRPSKGVGGGSGRVGGRGAWESGGGGSGTGGRRSTKPSKGYVCDRCGATVSGREKTEKIAEK